MRQITITQADDGTLSVEADGAEPYQCQSAEECLDYVEGLLSGGEEQEEPAEMAGMDAAAMWNEEAAKRSPQASLMA